MSYERGECVPHWCRLGMRPPEHITSLSTGTHTREHKHTHCKIDALPAQHCTVIGTTGTHPATPPRLLSHLLHAGGSCTPTQREAKRPHCEHPLIPALSTHTAPRICSSETTRSAPSGLATGHKLHLRLAAAKGSTGTTLQGKHLTEHGSCRALAGDCASMAARY